MVRRILPTALRIIAAAMLSFAMLFPHFLGLLGPLRLSAVVIGLVGLAVELLLGPFSRRTIVVFSAAAGLWCVGGIAGIELLARALDNRMFAVNAEHLLVLLPLYGVVGVLIYRSEGARVYLLTFLAFASVVAGLAIAEAALDRSLLGRDLQFLSSQREGLTRALVGSEHVLTLGATLAAAIPLTFKLRSLPARLLVCALLLAGCWASGSRAPAVLATAVAVVLFAPIVRRFFQRHLWIIFAGTAALLIGLAYLTVFVFTPTIAGSTGLQYSANYRGAMYSLLPRILSDHPLGYLLSGTPLGTWTVDSQLRGVVDIAISSDSEIVFAVFGLGWLGLTLYVVALFTAIGAVKKDAPVGFAAVSLTVLGLILALHGWDGMSPLWYALLGMSAYLVFVRFRTRAHAPPLGRHVPGRRRGHHRAALQPVDGV